MYLIYFHSYAIMFHSWTHSDIHLYPHRCVLIRKGFDIWSAIFNNANWSVNKFSIIDSKKHENVYLCSKPNWLNPMPAYTHNITWSSACQLALRHWPNVNPYVGPTSAHRRWANQELSIGPTLARQLWPNVASTLAPERWTNVGATLCQWLHANIGPTVFFIMGCDLNGCMFEYVDQLNISW